MTRVGALLVVLAASGLSAACNDELVDEVDASVCKSGLRWVGGNRGSEEMRPGSDCVGCHKDNDGPPLVFGGTLYLDAAYRDDDSPGDPSGKEGQRNCFGYEGVTLVVRGADGQEFEVVTNRAGNFFLEGQEEELVKPYSVKVNYVFPDGTPTAPEMTAGYQASYGGCARCHGTAIDRTDPAPPMMDEPSGPAPEVGDREYVFPASPIYVQSPRP